MLMPNALLLGQDSFAKKKTKMPIACMERLRHRYTGSVVRREESGVRALLWWARETGWQGAAGEAEESSKGCAKRKAVSKGGRVNVQGSEAADGHVGWARCGEKAKRETEVLFSTAMTVNVSLASSCGSRLVSLPLVTNSFLCVVLGKPGEGQSIPISDDDLKKYLMKSALKALKKRADGWRRAPSLP